MWYPYYTIRFQDDDRGRWVVEIQGEDAPAAAVVDIEAGDNPLEWKSDGDGSQTTTVIGATGTLNLYITDDTLPELAIGRILPDKALSRRVVAKREGVVIWVGFIQPQSFNQAWEAAPYEVGLAIMDTVAALQYTYIDIEDSFDNILDMLYCAYSRVGGELSRDAFIRTNTQLYIARDGTTQNNDDWGKGQLFPEFWTSDEENETNFADIIDTVLSPHGRLFQTGQSWFVGKDNTVTTNIYRPDGEGNFIADTEASVMSDITHAIGSASNNSSTLPPPAKITTSYTPDEGSINMSGDTIFDFSEKMIVSDRVIGNADLPASEGNPRDLRYLFLADVKGGFTHTSRTEYRYGYSPAVIVDERTSPGWAQVLVNTKLPLFDPDYGVEKALVFCGVRKCLNYSGEVYTGSVDEIAIQTPVYQERGTNKLKLEGKAMLMDLITQEYVGWLTNSIAASVAIYWGAKPGRKDLWYNSPWGWLEPFPSVLGAPRFGFGLLEDDGIVFDLPEGHNVGYITLEIYSGSGSGTVPSEYMVWANNTVVYESIKLSYITDNINPTKPMVWNKDAVNRKTSKVSGGTEDITLTFHTLAGGQMSGATYFAPRRGFDDSDHCVTSPREMIDIEAVKVTTPEGIPGITRFSLFQFNGKTYFPAAVGMNARDNTVSLKLIRTL